MPRLLLALNMVLAACAVGLRAGPAETVRLALDRIVPRDLAGASNLVAGTGAIRALPFVIEGFFAPLGSVLRPDSTETLRVMRLDASRLTVTAGPTTDRGVSTSLTGVLVQQYDVAATEALVRDYVAETRDQFEEALLRQALRDLGSGIVELEVAAEVPFVFEDGASPICPRLPGPGTPTAPPWLLDDDGAPGSIEPT